MDKYGIMEFLKHLGYEIGTLLAGASGAFIMMRKKSEKSWISKIGVILSGGLIANYLAPTVMKIISLPEGTQYFVGFIIGTMGIDVIVLIGGKLQEKIKKS